MPVPEPASEASGAAPSAPGGIPLATGGRGPIRRPHFAASAGTAISPARRPHGPAPPRMRTGGPGAGAGHRRAGGRRSRLVRGESRCGAVACTSRRVARTLGAVAGGSDGMARGGRGVDGPLPRVASTCTIGRKGSGEVANAWARQARGSVHQAGTHNGVGQCRDGRVTGPSVLERGHCPKKSGHFGGGGAFSLQPSALSHQTV